MCSKVNSYLSDLSRFLTARNLQLSPTKSTATIFTNWTKEYRLELDIAVDGVKIPTVNNPKILGVTLDSLCSFSPHTTAIIAKVQSRNKILKSLAGSTWGKDKETLLATYKAIGRPVLNYAAPIWSPRCRGTQMRKLQTCQNTALRTSTGCLLMSPIEHLHNETLMLPVKEHNELHSKPCLLGCFRRNHPCGHLLGAEPPPRNIPHTTAIIAKVQSRNKILKSLAGSTWRKDKETLATYKAIGRPVLNYAAPIWSPRCRGTQMRKLQTCQNTALRTSTGCLLMSPIEHLHSETRMLPVKEHNELLSRQFLLGCFRRNHPCSHLLGAEPPPRSIKRSFLDYVDDVVQYADRTSDATDFRQVLTAIHSGAINTFTDSLPVNGVLGVKAPPIADEELQLPRETRVTLAQLRSGYCSRLNSYLSRIDPDISNICPACNESPHDTGHLFACPTNPTHLTPSSLWSDPVETARFLGLPLDDLDDNTDNPYHPNGD
ncbi:uncharacterized protein LOC125779305 [Bactrocera dorsalis]|uniref:Uncharacterized protein LOC125779305 n=1 Tax=Bactrocera dorsalis TaxID=27457 RepID=A0ABM3K4Y3_BACDO|nr:uncharacterized protein LOC125779305 [Bactrocera dorsalis]